MKNKHRDYIVDLLSTKNNKTLAKDNKVEIKEAYEALCGFIPHDKSCEFCNGTGYLTDEHGTVECICMIRVLS